MLLVICPANATRNLPSSLVSDAFRLKKAPNCRCMCCKPGCVFSLFPVVQCEQSSWIQENEILVTFTRKGLIQSTTNSFEVRVSVFIATGILQKPFNVLVRAFDVASSLFPTYLIFSFLNVAYLYYFSFNKQN